MEELMTIQDVAAYLKMSPQTIYRMAQQGRIPALKAQSRWRFRRSDIESWLTPVNNGARGHILVVDDDPDIVNLFAHVLEPDGYQVVTVLTGRKAIQAVRQQSFGLIYLDLVLPDISGPETLKAIRQIDDTARVVVITGNQESNLLQEILEIGPFTVLVKPFGTNEIIETAKLCARRCHRLEEHEGVVMSGERILYIEDNLENRTLVKRILEAESFVILEADDGPSGMRVAEQEAPALILMDINLPEIDGYEVTAKLRQIPSLAHVPIVALTANVLKGDRERSLAAGCDGYIQKPVDVDLLPAQIAAFLRAGRKG